MLASPEPQGSDQDRPVGLYQFFTQQHEYTLAGHRSHSSHRSDSSHRSRSGGGGGGGTYRSPPPPPAPAAPLRSTPRPSTANSTPPSSVLPQTATLQKLLRGNSTMFANTVIRVQSGLFAFGYYTGAIDGFMGPETKTALMKFQADRGMPVTGTITAEDVGRLATMAGVKTLVLTHFVPTPVDTLYTQNFLSGVRKLIQAADRWA